MSSILGINAFHAGASAALLIEGVPVAAVAEERLNRVKYYAGFPVQAIEFCLKHAGITLADLDYIAVGRNPASNRAAKTAYLLSHPRDWGKALKLMANTRLRSMESIEDLLSGIESLKPSKFRGQRVPVEHHVAHIAGSYFTSPWDEAAGLSIDGSGDFVTVMQAMCRGENIEVLDRQFMPHSPGIFYTAISQLIGYQSYGDEGKVMGLAPLGSDALVETLRSTFTVSDGVLELTPKFYRAFGAQQNQAAIDDRGIMAMQSHYTDALAKKMGGLHTTESFGETQQDMAFAVQRCFEEIYFSSLEVLERKTGQGRLALGGGCALNSAANGKIFEATSFSQTEIMPAAGDDGLALGAALYVSNAVLKEGKRIQLSSPYLGPEYSDSEIRSVLESSSLEFAALDTGRLLAEVADRLFAGEIIGWFQGRAEWGPRALGARSILAHPGFDGMKDKLNARVKGREWFRPFAPSILAEKQSEVFERNEPSPFMTHVYKIREQYRDKLPAVAHVDGTGRLQTVDKQMFPLYHRLISAFYERSDIPLVLNTSFNENEPMVCRPLEAVECFERTEMDALAIGGFLATKR